MACFHRAVRYDSLQNSVARSRFPFQKYGRKKLAEPYLFFSTPPLGYQAVWKGTNKVELHTLSVDWLTESSLPCDRRIKTNKQQMLRFWNKISRKCLPSFLDVLHCCSLYIVCVLRFHGFISRLHFVALLWDHNAYVAAVAIAVRIKPRPP